VGAEWVRCKTCHAWDGLGNAASYSNRTGQSTGAASRPDVSTLDLLATIASSTPLELFSKIKGEGGRAINTQGNGHPDYSTILSDAQIWNLVKFMREGWIYPAAGAAAYTAKCGGCHGANGTTINLAGASVGELVRTKPNEMWHKFKFGQISDSSVASMVPGLVADTTEMVDLYSALADPVAFPDI
jgi:mono/diheme cytochrome c family protein